MQNDGQEIEAKFYLGNLAAFENRLLHLGAELISPRVLEINLRFDLPDGSLTAARQVLRLRRDAVTRLTFKGPAQPGEMVSMRREIEFEVSDYQAARQLLEALGYHVSIFYEKYRTTYALNGCEVVLDELPYGLFVEIEAVNAEAIYNAAKRLGLDWDARIADSYLGLFARLKAATGLEAENLAFDELSGWRGDLAAIGLRRAD